MEPGVAPTPTPSPSPSLSPTSNTTTLLGKYQLGWLLGRVSFAKVYQARSIVDDTAVAVKIIDKSKTVDAAMEPRIIREIMAMRRLQDHPNLLKILEVMATKTKIYLVVELATGGELFSKISHRDMLAGQFARRYFQQLVSALHFSQRNDIIHNDLKPELHFCHQNGTAHRDVKPQNLLVQSEDIVSSS